MEVELFSDHDIALLQSLIMQRARRSRKTDKPQPFVDAIEPADIEFALEKSANI